MKKFSKDSLPVETEEWNRFRKKMPVRAKRIEGPFEVQTKEGTLQCEDGYLVLDASGYPYPIAREDFEEMYRPVD